MNARLHAQLLETYLANGGSHRIAEGIKSFNLQNFAKLKYEIKKQEPQAEKQDAKTENPQPQKQEPKVFKDHISEYPVELHPVYRRRWEVWLEACSLKVHLNKLTHKPEDEEKAFEIQLNIYKCFLHLDECEKILKHYREYKRLMPTETKTDFEKMTELEIHNFRNNLRSNITRRRQTIEKMERALGENPTPRELHSINLKREQLQEKINDLLECEKYLNNGKQPISTS